MFSLPKPVFCLKSYSEKKAVPSTQTLAKNRTCQKKLLSLLSLKYSCHARYADVVINNTVHLGAVRTCKFFLGLARTVPRATIHLLKKRPLQRLQVSRYSGIGNFASVVKFNPIWHTVFSLPSVIRCVVTRAIATFFSSSFLN